MGEDVGSRSHLPWRGRERFSIDLPIHNEWRWGSRIIRGTVVPGQDIPVNRGPTIAGIVEIGRGCWRGCTFCSPTMRTMRHRPLENILEDVHVNLSAGQTDILLHSEDVFTYGSSGMKPDEKRSKNLCEK